MAASVVSDGLVVAHVIGRLAFGHQAEPVEGGGGLFAAPFLRLGDLFEFLFRVGVLREFSERAGAGEAEVELLGHQDVVVDGLVAEREGFGVLLVGEGDLRQAGEAVVGVFRGAGMLEDVAEIIGGLLLVALRKEAVADHCEDGRVELLRLVVGGNLGEVGGGLLGFAGKDGELAEGEEAACLRHEGFAVVVQAEQLDEFLLGFGAGVGAWLGRGTSLHALNLTGEFLGQKHDELLGALLGAVVDGFGDGVGENLERALLLVGDGDLALYFHLGEFALEFGGELADGRLGDVDLGLGDARLALERIDGLTGVGELGTEILADLLGFGGEFRHVAHAFGGADDLVEVGHRLRVIVVPVEDLFEQVAHALVFAAAGEEFAELAKDEFKGLRIGAGAPGGGLVSVDGLIGDDFLLLLGLGLDLDELGLFRGLGVEADVEVGGLDLLVDLVGEGDVGVANQRVDLGHLGHDLLRVVLGVILEPVFAELDGAGDVARAGAELDDGLAVADVGDELALRVFLFVLIEVGLGFLVLALEERAERVHVEHLLADRGARVLLEEFLESLLGGCPVDLREEAGGDTEVDLFDDLGREALYVGLDPLVVGDGLGELFAFLRDVAENQRDRGDLFILWELRDELLALRLGLVVAADAAQGEDVVVVGSGDSAEAGAVLEDVEEGHVGLPRALQFEETEADTVGDERVVILVGVELFLDLLELHDLLLGLLEVGGLFGVRLGEVLGQRVDLVLLGLDGAAEGAAEIGATQRALVIGEGLTVKVGAEIFVGSRFGAGKAGVADFEALEVGADDFDG